MGIFTPGGSSSNSSSGTISYTNPASDELTIPSAATEYTYQLPIGTKKFRVQLRGVATLQVRFISGGPTAWTVGAGAVYEESNLSLSSPLDLFVLSSQPSQVLEILYWT